MADVLLKASRTYYGLLGYTGSTWFKHGIITVRDSPEVKAAEELHFFKVVGGQKASPDWKRDGRRAASREFDSPNHSKGEMR